MRVHLRWEAYNLEALDTALADIAAGRVHLVAFNDHTPSILRKIADPVAGAKYSERAGMALHEFRELAVECIGRRAHRSAGRLWTASARPRGPPGCRWPVTTIIPWPRGTRSAPSARASANSPWPSRSVAHAVAAGDWVAMGSPNVVRGRSHLGWASAARLAEEGICTVLTSDYFYPAMLRAALILARRGVLDLPAAWALISANPARATGLLDRGAIAEGQRADLVLVDPTFSRPVATIAAGRIAHLTADASARLSWDVG